MLNRVYTSNVSLYIQKNVAHPVLLTPHFFILLTRRISPEPLQLHNHSVGMLCILRRLNPTKIWHIYSCAGSTKILNIPRKHRHVIKTQNSLHSAENRGRNDDWRCIHKTLDKAEWVTFYVFIRTTCYYEAKTERAKLLYTATWRKRR